MIDSSHMFLRQKDGCVLTVSQLTETSGLSLYFRIMAPAEFGEGH